MVWVSIHPRRTKRKVFFDGMGEPTLTTYDPVQYEFVAYLLFYQQKYAIFGEHVR